MHSLVSASHRRQRTIARPAEVRGVGFLTGADVKLRFLPADDNHGLAYRRTDRIGIGVGPIPATIESTVPRQRRTAVEHGGLAIEMTEHVLAALAGLKIDNCLIELNAPEPPGCDGSSKAFVDALLEAGIVEQEAPRTLFVVDRGLKAIDEKAGSTLAARPISPPSLVIGYDLDYGPGSPIPPQKLAVEITPESFVRELAWARTFVLETEVKSLKAQGYGRRTTARDLLVFGTDGVIDNQLRAVDECARHKILDCVGDFALLGCDLCGHFEAARSGHRLNRELIRGLKEAAAQRDARTSQAA